MRRAIAFVVAAVMCLTAGPIVAAGAGRGQQPGASVAGTATSPEGRTLGNATVRLRDLTTGQLAGTTTSSANGEFSFVGLPAGTFVIEIVSATGVIVGTSTAISVAAGATVTGVTVSATAAAVGVAAGGAAAAAGAAAAGAGTAAGISTAVVVTTVAAAAGVAGAVAVANSGTASPSR